MSFQVRDSLCRSCIFGQNSPISQERFDQLKQEWQDKDIVQECHSGTLIHDHIGCRGHYEAARRGELPKHPLDAIRDQMGFSISRADFMQIAERMKWVEFVVESEKDMDKMTIDDFIQKLRAIAADVLDEDVGATLDDLIAEFEGQLGFSEFRFHVVLGISDTRYNLNVPDLKERLSRIKHMLQDNPHLQTYLNSEADILAENLFGELPDEDQVDVD